MVSDTTIQETAASRLEPTRQTAVLAVVYSPSQGSLADRYRIENSVVIGRQKECDLAIDDQRMSKQHFCISLEGETHVLTDLGSSNGTRVDGVKVETALLGDQHVIRAGRTVMVFHPHAPWLLQPAPKETYGIIGPFHTAGILASLGEAAVEKRHILLAGPSGAGKELATRAFAGLLGGAESLPVLAHNCARFTSEEEATSTLFGVKAKVFSNVEARPGLIELAHGGILMLDEVNILPQRVQRSLLRVIEDGQTMRIGENRPRDADVRFVFASNQPGPTSGLAHDLFARLRCVKIPSLGNRRADIPAMFAYLLRAAAVDQGADPDEIEARLTADHIELLCNGDFEAGNVRQLKDIALRIVTKTAVGKPVEQALSEVFSEHFEGGRDASRGLDGDVSFDEDQKTSSRLETLPISTDPSSRSRYERHKAEIIRTYHACRFNISATKRELEKQGISTSRRWLTQYLKDWGV